MPTDMPPVLCEQRTARALLPAGLVVVCLIEEASTLRPALRAAGLAPDLAWLVSVAAGVIGLVTLGALLRHAFGSQLTAIAPPGSRWAARGLAVTVGTAAAGAAARRLGLPAAVALGIGLADAAATLALARALAQAHWASRGQRLMTLANPDQAEGFVDDARAELSDPALDGAEREIVELALAAARADWSCYDGRYERLPEALGVIERSAGRVPPAWMVGAVLLLGHAMTKKAVQMGDVNGLETTLELLADALRGGGPAPLPIVQRMMLCDRVDGLLVLSAVAQEAGNAARAAQLRAEAVAELQRAYPVTGRWSIERAELMIAHASIARMQPGSIELEPAIERCRKTLHELRLRRFSHREAGYLTLADLLDERAEAAGDGERATRDRTEAMRLCELVARRGRHPHHGLYRLALLHALLGSDEAVTAGAFRRAYSALTAVTLEQAGDLADCWVQWALDRGSTNEAAEAHWCLLRAVAGDSRRRQLRAEPQHERSEVQVLAAETAYWLIAGSRSREAALALDLGRTVQFAEQMQRERASLEERLVEAARWDLVDRVRSGGRRAAPHAAVRRTRVVRTDTHTLVGGQRFRPHGPTGDYAGLGEQERLMREIGRLAGFEDVPLAATYAELRDAARDGPLTYIAATGSGGFAVVVTETTAEPAVVMLPGLAGDEVRHRAAMLIDHGAGADDTAQLEATLEWLGRCVVAPLAGSVERGALVTLVLVGALGLLPVHAAGRRRGPDGRWQDSTDGLVFRLAPDARALLRAQEAARNFAGMNVPLLTVEAAEPPAAHEPRYDRRQSLAVAEQFVDTLGGRPARSTDDVLAALADAAVWHVTCPFEHDAQHPLAGNLQLVDGPLEIGTVLAKAPGRQRLAVLSAADTAIADPASLEERASVATAWLDGIVAGVVSSWLVADERATMLLVVRFFQRVLDGVDPPRALAEAQAWLANATNHELHDTLGDLHRPPDELTLQMLRDWTGRCEFAHPRCWALFSYSGA